MRNRKIKLAVGIGSAVLVAGGVAGFAGLANADPSAQSKTYVDGFDGLTDDFSDNADEAGVLCEGCDNSQDTDLVLMWQSILASHNYLLVGDIDGDFGKATAEATREFQEVNGLEADGEVGDATWDLVDDRLHWSTEEDDLTVIYGDLSDGYVTFYKDFDGVYRFETVADDDGGVLVNASGAEKIQLFEETITLEKA